MNKKTLILVTVSAIFLALSAYAYKAMTYKDRFLPNTTLNGVSIEKLTAASASELLAKEKTQSITVSADSKQLSSDSTRKAGLEPIATAQIIAELNKQNPMEWLLPTTHDIKLVPTVNQDTHQRYLQTIREKITALNADAPQTKNAEVVFKDDAFLIAPEQYGATINVEEEVAALEAAILKGQTVISIDSANTKPTILKDDPALQQTLTSTNKILNQPYTYVINGQDILIPKASIAGMLQPNQNDIVNPAAVAAYLSTLGKNYNTSTNATTFSSTRKGEIEVPVGTFSWTIDEATEATALVEALKNAHTFKRPPAFVGSTTPETALIGNTYIEVDLANQHMWFYQNGNLVLETDVVTGKPSTPTPLGVDYVWKKERNATLTGEDYASPVDYWMPIDWTGVGIHDSNWQSAYGGDRFVEHGSHGCVNTPPAIMKQLFETADIGTPVVVF